MSSLTLCHACRRKHWWPWTRRTYQPLLSDDTSPHYYLRSLEYVDDREEKELVGDEPAEDHVNIQSEASEEARL